MAIFALLYWHSPKSLDFLLLPFTSFLKKNSCLFSSLFHLLTVTVFDFLRMILD